MAQPERDLVEVHRVPIWELRSIHSHPGDRDCGLSLIVQAIEGDCDRSHTIGYVSRHGHFNDSTSPTIHEPCLPVNALQEHDTCTNEEAERVRESD
jgi:hypothetical protein